MWDLAIANGEDPNDPHSILFGGTPSDTASYQEHEQPGEHDDIWDHR